MLSKPMVKYIQSLQHKKFRDEFNVFVAEGPKVVSELLADGSFLCKQVIALDNWINSIDDATKAAVTEKIEQVEVHELEKISGLSTPNQVLAVFEKKPSIESFNPAGNITLVLDDIQDPGNLGTMIRTADWFGVQHIVCSKQTADMYNSKVVQSTMASLGRVNVVYTDLFNWLSQQHSIPKYAATLQGVPVDANTLPNEAILLIGNESKGISSALMDCVDHQITINKWGTAESLNAAVATGILLQAFRK
jgi:TrmH family RNA methyltransferase